MINPGTQSVRFARNRHPGFTLTELIAVIAVIAITAGIGLTTGMQSYRKLVVEKGARDIFSLMRYAKIAAVEYQGEVTLQIDKENRGAWLEAMRTNTLTGLREKEMIRNSFCKPVKLAADVEFQNVVFLSATESESRETSEEGSGILFYPNGSATDVAVQLGNKQHSYTVILHAATGRAHLHLGEIKEQSPTTIDLDMES